LLLGEQQGSPSATWKQAGKAGVVVGHRYLGTVPNVMAEATTTPMGCQMDKRESRKRRFWGKNSRAKHGTRNISRDRPFVTMTTGNCTD